MACSSCGKRATATYPRVEVMPDGSRVTVSSAAQARAERERITTQMRVNGKGWSATR